MSRAVTERLVTMIKGMGPIDYLAGLAIGNNLGDLIEMEGESIRSVCMAQAALAGEGMAQRWPRAGGATARVTFTPRPDKDPTDPQVAADGVAARLAALAYNQQHDEALDVVETLCQDGGNDFIADVLAAQFILLVHLHRAGAWT